MQDHSFIELEQMLAASSPHQAPPGLRADVLAGVQSELRAARWDRRLVRTATVLFLLGIGTNASLGLRASSSSESHQLRGSQLTSRQSLLEMAVVVAEATDAGTANQIARQLAVLSGRTLTAGEAAAIDAAVRHAAAHESTNGDKG